MIWKKNPIHQQQSTIDSILHSLSQRQATQPTSNALPIATSEVNTLHQEITDLKNEIEELKKHQSNLL